MNVYLIGYNGWIGSKMQKLFKLNNINYITSKYRAENNQVLDDILNNNITHVFCCSGRTHGTLDNIKYNSIDYLEDNRVLYENINDNLYVPVKLALFCDKNNIHFTYIGTGCIYEYNNFNKQDIGFTEEDEPNFSGSNYSIVKTFTDKILKDTKALILRIRMPLSYEHNDRNLITKLLKYDKICSIPNSMTILDDMLPISIDMMKNKETGIYNFTNPGTISHNEILELYKNIVDNNIKWENFDIEEQNKIIKSKRSNNKLDTSKLEQKYNIINIKDGIINMFNNMKNNNNS
jgi:nucleoside-diphosphate-sugar epimerase